MRKCVNININKQYICLKSNIGQLYFILGRAELCWIISSLLVYSTASDITSSVELRVLCHMGVRE